MDLKKLLFKKATNTLLPMVAERPKIGAKTKAAAILSTIATAATVAEHFLNG